MFRLLLCYLFVAIILLSTKACRPDDACVSQEEKEVLVASYLRLADLLKGMSDTVCEQLAQYKHEKIDGPTMAESCKEIDDIIIRLKAVSDLSEAQRDEYNKTLTAITKRIVDISQHTQDQKLAKKMNTLRQSMEKELKIVRDKNIKLTSSKTRAETVTQKALQERNAAINAQKNAEAALAQYQQTHKDMPLSATEQQRINRLQAEVERSKKEKDAAIAAQKRLEEAQKDLKNQLEQAKMLSAPVPPKDETPTEKKQENIVPKSPETTPVSPTAIMTEQELKLYIQQRFSEISPTRRNRDEKDKLRQLFADYSAEIIYTDNNSYSIDNYWDKLSLLGPYDIHVLELKTDLQGKITKLKIEETRLVK